MLLRFPVLELNILLFACCSSWLAATNPRSLHKQFLVRGNERHLLYKVCLPSSSVKRHVRGCVHLQNCIDSRSHSPFDSRKRIPLWAAAISCGLQTSKLSHSNRSQVAMLVLSPQPPNLLQVTQMFQCMLIPRASDFIHKRLCDSRQTEGYKTSILLDCPRYRQSPRYSFSVLEDTENKSSSLSTLTDVSKYKRRAYVPWEMVCHEKRTDAMDVGQQSKRKKGDSVFETIVKWGAGSFMTAMVLGAIDMLKPAISEEGYAETETPATLTAPVSLGAISVTFAQMASVMPTALPMTASSQRQQTSDSRGRNDPPGMSPTYAETSAAMWSRASTRHIQRTATPATPVTGRNQAGHTSSWNPVSIALVLVCAVIITTFTVYYVRGTCCSSGNGPRPNRCQYQEPLDATDCSSLEDNTEEISVPEFPHHPLPNHDWSTSTSGEYMCVPIKQILAAQQQQQQQQHRMLSTKSIEYQDVISDHGEDDVLHVSHIHEVYEQPRDNGDDGETHTTDQGYEQPRDGDGDGGGGGGGDGGELADQVYQRPCDGCAEACDLAQGYNQPLDCGGCGGGGSGGETIGEGYEQPRDGGSQVLATSDGYEQPHEGGIQMMAVREG